MGFAKRWGRGDEKCEEIPGALGKNGTTTKSLNLGWGKSTRVMGSRCREFKGQSCSHVFIERGIRAPKSQLVIPSFKTLRRNTSATGIRYKRFLCLDENHCASLAYPAPPPPSHDLFLQLPYPVVKLQEATLALVGTEVPLGTGLVFYHHVVNYNNLAAYSTTH